MTVVLFAGMGGGCDGLEEAGFHVHLAINHDPVAVAVHEKRHPHTRHLRCDVFEVCPREATGGRGVRILHASPDCTHFSIAKGGKPVSRRRRSLAWVVVRWAGQAGPEIITLENVPEIQTWGPLIAKRCPMTGRAMRRDGSVAAKGERVPVQDQWLIPDPKHRGRIWKAWLKHMRSLGYIYDGKVMVCADYGVATIRKRYFGVARRDGLPVQWPERTHAPRDQARKLGLKPWRGIHEVIDWSLPVKSIFGRAKPLAEATMRRIARGVMRYVVNAGKPFIVPITHSGDDRVHSIDEPGRTMTTAHRGEMSVVVPHLSVMRNSEKPYYGAADPAHAFTAGGAGHALVAATLDRQFGKSVGADIGEPGPTTTPGGNGKTALVAAFLSQNNFEEVGHSALEPCSTIVSRGTTQSVVAAHLTHFYSSNTCGGQGDPREPVKTITADGNHAGVIMAFLQAYYSANGGYEQALSDPLGALTAKARHGLVTVKVDGKDYAIVDIGIRMLEPEEGAATHGFKPGSLPATITIDGKERRLTKTEKYHLVGNSVPPRMVRLLAECNARRELMVAAE